VAKPSTPFPPLIEEAPRALAWLEDYTGIPYPFGKFDFLLVPAAGLGGAFHLA
jgi:aminopeptidase N